MNILYLYCIQLIKGVKKRLANIALNFYLCFTQRPNFFGFGVVEILYTLKLVRYLEPLTGDINELMNWSWGQWGG